VQGNIRLGAGPWAQLGYALGPKKSILISKIFVYFSASSFYGFAPLLQLVWRRHWSEFST